MVFVGTADKEAFGRALPTVSTAYKEMRSHLQKTLPAYMLPAIIVSLEALPLLPNGKINRKALPEPLLETMSEPALHLNTNPNT